MDRASSYAHDVVEGRIDACKWVKLACKRHLHDLAKGYWVWDEDEVNQRLAFFPLLRHVKGPLAGNPFHPEPWQDFIIGSVYGWKHPETGDRRFRFAYIEVPRKNGKTFTAAGFAMMGLICGRSGFQSEPGAEVYAVATKEDQAKLVWRDVSLMAKRSPGFSDLVLTRLKEIRFEYADSIFKPLGSDSNTLDGLNPYVAIFDELHAWENGELWNVITDGLGARAEPLVVQITTAGYNQEFVCWEQRGHVCSVLQGFEDGGYLDENYFGIIYTIDEGDDPWDERVWAKANPCLGAAKKIEFMRVEAAQARNSASKRNAFLNKQLNVWTTSEEVWLPLEKWDACDRPLPSIEELRGMRCVGALDLSNTCDISALVWEFQMPDGSWAFLPRLFVPEQTMEQRARKHRLPYDLWALEGWVIPTTGDVIDYSFIREQIAKDAELFDIAEIAYDRYNATETVTILQEQGFDMVECRQGMLTMSPAMKALETEILSKRVIHGGHPVLRWMMGNVQPERDAAGNIKPSKARSREKIDGVVAMIMAHSRMMTLPGSKRSVYEDRDLVIL